MDLHQIVSYVLKFSANVKLGTGDVHKNILPCEFREAGLTSVIFGEEGG